MIVQVVEFLQMYSSCNYYQNQDTKYFHCPRKFPPTLLWLISYFIFGPRQPLICFLSLRISLHFLKFHTNDIRRSYDFVSQFFSQYSIFRCKYFSFCSSLFFLPNLSTIITTTAFFFFFFFETESHAVA